MEEKDQNIEKMTFKRYYDGMTDADQRSFRMQIMPYITESHFYRCLREGKFSLLMSEKIESVLNQQFDWTNEQLQ